MLRIGLIDLDTSHARSFTQILNRPSEVRVTGVFDGGAVRTRPQVERFCEQFDCRRYETVEALAEQVDAAMVLSADWEVHLDRLEPLLRAGVPTYVDKPVAGRVDELDRYVRLAEEAASPVLTGSGWRFNVPMEQARPEWADRTIDFAHAIVGGDLLYYGVHVVEAILGLLGPGLETVQWRMGDEEAAVVEFTHRRGTRGRMLVGGQTVFRGVTFESGSAGHAVTFSGHDIHEGACQALLKMVEQGVPPLSPREQTESVRAVLAAHESARTGQPTDPASLPPEARYSSGPFMERYLSHSQPGSLLGTPAPHGQGSGGRGQQARP